MSGVAQNEAAATPEDAESDGLRDFDRHFDLLFGIIGAGRFLSSYSGGALKGENAEKEARFIACALYKLCDDLEAEMRKM